jgi:outer membrane lipoprotein SlyB
MHNLQVTAPTLAPHRSRTMTTKPLLAIALLPLLTTACVSTRTTTQTWGDPYGYGEQYGQEWQRPGRVTAIRETVTEQKGDPAAGAVAGAIVGGLLGSAIGGHTHYDRWGRAYSQPSGAGAVVGAVGGAMVGAAASQGQQGQQRTYEIFVRYDDGGTETVVYQGSPPFRVGEWVVQTPRGLQARR